MRERAARRRRLPVTVCIAARSIDGLIFCVSDRMVTTGDIEVEQPTPKILGLTSSIVAMPSDEDATLHSEILQDLSIRVSALVAANPKDWLVVKDVAELYLDCRNTAKRKRAERDFLLPLGLNQESFIERQRIMDPALVDQISRDMIQYPLPSLALILAGIDAYGAHIYVIHDNDLGCYDPVGYAAIGAGARHANAQFSLVGHTWHSPTPEAMLWTYVAKKRAEIAPGVGTTTDFHTLGPGLGTTSILRSDHAAKLEREYQRIKKREDAARNVAVKEMNEYVKGLAEAAAAQPPQAQANPPSESPKEPTNGTGA